VLDTAAFKSSNVSTAAAGAATNNAEVQCFTFQYEKIFIVTSMDSPTCFSMSPKWQQAISSIMTRTGVSDAHAITLTARHGPNEFIVEIPTFAEVSTPCQRIMNCF
jgi:hypothetical protein